MSLADPPPDRHGVADKLRCSLLASFVQPDEVLQGREEIGVYWREGVSTGETEALLDAARGAIQLLFGDHPDDLVARVIGIALPLAIRNWAETGAKGVRPTLRLSLSSFLSFVVPDHP